MSDIWFTGCSHFFHESILRFKMADGTLLRPEFSSVKEMNAYMVEMWNSHIKKEDTVYHLGDVFYGKNADKEAFKRIFNSLHGQRKILIMGNHDDGRFQTSLGWSKVRAQQGLDSDGLFLSHYPTHISSLYSFKVERILLNVHAHIHKNSSPEGPYFNVCVERNAYKPFHIEDLKAVAKQMEV